MLLLMSMLNGFAQNSTVLKQTPYYQIITNENDTLICLTSSKDELSQFREYVTILEANNKKYYLNKEEIIVLNDKILLLQKERSNYIKMLDLCEESVSEQEKIIAETKSYYEDKIKKSNRKLFRKGLLFGGIGGFILCALIM